MSETVTPTPASLAEQIHNPRQATGQDCFACRIIGATALGGVGVYALNQSRAHQPGSMVGKRIMGGLGVCEWSSGWFYCR